MKKSKTINLGKINIGKLGYNGIFSKGQLEHQVKDFNSTWPKETISNEKIQDISTIPINDDNLKKILNNDNIKFEPRIEIDKENINIVSIDLILNKNK